jgi:hypothetical protein
LDWANAGEASIVTKANAMPVTAFVVMIESPVRMAIGQGTIPCCRLDQMG